MTLDEREAHCIARLLQGAWFANEDGGFASSVATCQYCKYQCYKESEEHNLKMLSKIRKRLTEETGVDLGYETGAFLINSDFPYHKFLKNANEEIRNYFSNRFQKYLRAISSFNGQ